MDTKKLNVVVLGAGGMLGHMLTLNLIKNKCYRVFPFARRQTGVSSIDANLKIFNLSEKDTKFDQIGSCCPDVVVNCIAQLFKDKKLSFDAYWLNAAFPKQLANYLDTSTPRAKLIHISTDGVFSGRQGYYSESDKPDPIDDYGRSKLEGEVTYSPHCTIRTSIIGPELNPRMALFEWVRSQRGKIQGYNEVFWNGVTTLELCRCIDLIIKNNICGLLHIHGESVSKAQLIQNIVDVFELDITVNFNDSNRMNRSLATNRKDFSHPTPNLRQMLIELKEWMNNNKD